MQFARQTLKVGDIVKTTTTVPTIPHKDMYGVVVGVIQHEGFGILHYEYKILFQKLDCAVNVGNSYVDYALEIQK